MKRIKCAIIGRPSSGKSTFLNTICENKVSIVSSIPQSTITSLNGIYTDSRGSVIFTDTPGLHIDEREFNKRLSRQAINAIRNSECILYIMDAADRVGDEEKKIAFYASTSNKPVVVLINKVDIASKADVDEKKKFVADNVKKAVVFTGSALKDEGLDEVLIELFSIAEDCEDFQIDENLWTDTPLEMRVSEEIRQSIFDNTYSEVPHSVFVDVDSITLSEDEKRVQINAQILVQQSSQKGILIGKGGAMIKKIRTQSQKSLRRIFPDFKVDLFLSVKVHPKWKSDERILDKLNL